MITIGKASSASAADYKSYLSGDQKNGALEYYADENVPSQWAGELAAQQGRCGEVTEKDFVEALAGKIKDGTGERIMSDERSNWIAGYDVSIAAPKSVSIEALVHGNNDALEAHREAVSEAIKNLEDGIGSRVTQGGKTGFERTGNAQIAQFEHHESFAGDPHLHTHNVVVNNTICDDGKARAIDAKSTIYGRVNEITETYHQALEQKLQEKGIATYRDENNSPQIAGYDKSGMREFSERQKQMDEKLQERGTSFDKATPQERELARQETRHGLEMPEPKSKEETQAAWQEKAAAAREAGAQVGPAQRVDNAAEKSDKTPEPAHYSRDEFKEAKYVLNEGKAAEARLESGRWRNEEHKEQLEARVESMEKLRDEKPELYVKAEKAVEKMGVRDIDDKIEAEAARRLEVEAAKQAAGQARAEEKQIAMQSGQDRREAEWEAKGVQYQNAKVEQGAQAALENAGKAIEAVADKNKTDEQVKKDAEKAKDAADEKARIAQEINAAGSVDLKAAESAAAVLSKAQGGERQEIEKALKDAAEKGEIKTAEDAKKFAEMKVEEVAGRATVNEQKAEDAQKTIERGGYLGTKEAVDKVEAAKAEKEKIAEEQKAEKWAQESAALRSIVEKYGSAEQKAEYGLQESRAGNFETAEEKEKRERAEHKEHWGY